jgi:hypothetical protein
MRRRNATSGLPVTSYAVITNTLSGFGSRTYTIRKILPASVLPIATRELFVPGRSSSEFAKTLSDLNVINIMRINMREAAYRIKIEPDIHPASNSLSHIDYSGR